MATWALGGLAAFFLLGGGGAYLSLHLVLLFVGCFLVCALGLAIASWGQARALGRLERPRALTGGGQGS